MSGLQVVPILCRRLWGLIAEHFPLADRPDLIDHKGQRMLCITRFVVVDWAETTLTDTARRIHRLESCAILPAQIAVCIAWIS